MEADELTAAQIARLLTNPALVAALNRIRRDLNARGYPMGLMDDSQLLRGVLSESVRLGAQMPSGLAEQVKSIRAIVRKTTTN